MVYRPNGSRTPDGTQGAGIEKGTEKMDLVERLKADRAQLVAAHLAHLETIDMTIERMESIRSFAAGGPNKHTKRANGAKNGAPSNNEARPRGALAAARAKFAALTDWSTPAELRALAPDLKPTSVHTLVSEMRRLGQLRRRGELGAFKYRGAKRGALG